MSRRGRLKFDGEENVYFVTTSILGFFKIFSINESYMKILADSLKFVINRGKADLIGYVFMKDHIHLLLHLQKTKSIIAFVRDFKKFTSKEIHRLLKSDNLDKTLKRLCNLSGTGKYKLWNDRYDCQLIYSEKILMNKLNYIHMNPVKAGYVKKMTDWKYSSAINYYCNNNPVIDVNMGFIL